MDNKEKKRYDAFISYRHCEPDSFVAKSLEKALETLKLPKSVKSTTNVKKIDRIFRDEDELPVATSLSDQIEYALRESEYLICLCSPRYLESKWCMKEVETFINLYGRDKILLVLVDGEPDESFPELMKKEETKVIAPDGTETTEYKTIEPLAADVRGKDNKERKKKIDDTALRLSAAMLGVNYDDLKQRHRERKMRKIISAISTALVCMLIFSGVCLGMLFRIQKQSLEIQAQSTEIQKQSNEILKNSAEIAQKNTEIENQYTEISTKYAISTAENSIELLDYGRKEDAVYALRHVLPSSYTDTTLPYTSEAQYMLSDALDLYPKEMYLDSSFDFGGSFSFINTNLDDCFGIVDETHTLYLYNIKKRDPIAVFKTYCKYGASPFAFIDSDNVVFQKDDRSLVKYNVRTNEETILFVPDTKNEAFGDDLIYNNVFADIDCPYYAVSKASIIDVYDKADDKVAFTVSLSDYFESILGGSLSDVTNKVLISKDAKYMIISIHDTYIRGILAIDLVTKEPVYTKLYGETFRAYTESVHLYDDGKLIFAHTTDDTLVTSSIEYVDLNEGKSLWHNDSLGMLLEDCGRTVHVDDKDCVYVTAYDTLYTLDAENGEIVNYYVFPSKIVKCTYVNEYILFVLLKNGNAVEYYPNTLSYLENEYFSHSPNMDLDKAVFTKSGLIICPLHKNYVSFYAYNDNESETSLYKLTSNNISSISKNRMYYITKDRKDDKRVFSVYETSTNKRMMTVKSDDGDLFFVGDGSKQVVLAASDTSAVYNIEDSSKAFSVNTVDDYIAAKNISADGKILYSRLNEIFKAYSLEDGRKITEITLDRSDFCQIFVTSYNTVIFAYNDSAYVEYYDLLTGKKIDSIDIGADYAQSVFISDDGRYFCITYPDGNINIYDASDSLKKIKTIYEDYSTCTSMVKVENSDMYLLRTAIDYFLVNSDLCPIFRYTSFRPIAIDAKEKIIYVEHNRGDFTYINTLPFFDYDDLIEAADKYLGDYFPSEETRERYNLLQ